MSSRFFWQHFYFRKSYFKLHANNISQILPFFQTNFLKKSLIFKNVVDLSIHLDELCINQDALVNINKNEKNNLQDPFPNLINFTINLGTIFY